jgi:strictosidine synthase
VSGVVFVGLAITLVWTSPIAPVEWAPPPDVLGPTACAGAPGVLARVLVDDLPGVPDGLAFHPDGALRVALSNGSIVAVDPTTGAWRVVAQGGGHLTGLAVAPNGDVYVVDERAGALLRATADGRLEPLLDSLDGRRLRWTNDVAVASDGLVSLTTTSQRRGLDEFYFEVLEHRGSGQLIEYDPTTEAARAIAENLQMTNGLAVDTRRDGLLVAESATYGVRSVARDGRLRAEITGLPGFTGNVRAADRSDRYWVTLLSPRSNAVDVLAPHPLLRHLLARLPSSIRPRPRPLPCVIEIEGDDDILRARAIQIRGNAPLPSFSTAIERAGHLYLSSAGIASSGDGRLFVATLDDALSDSWAPPSIALSLRERKSRSGSPSASSIARR